MQNKIKKRVLNLTLVNLLIFSLSTPTAFAKGDPEAGKQKSGPCVACHQTDGNSATPAWPKIAGQHESYLIQQLKEMRKGDQGKRSNPAMYGVVSTLSDQDIEDLAAYYAAQKQTPGEAQKSLVEKGRKIYHGGIASKSVPACSGCHQPTGGGNRLAKFPAISGQHAEYTEAQLKAFKAGQRSNDPNEIMRNISAKMSEEEIKAVSSYISGLHGSDK